jgi:DNA-binding transcriptional LysR family regulator
MAETPSPESAGWCAANSRSASSRPWARSNVPALLARFHRRHPAVTLRLHQAGVASLVRQTADGELELAIVDLPLGPQASRVGARAIGTESLLLGVAAPDPLANRSRIRRLDLADRDFVEYRSDSSLRASIDEACHAAGLERRVACEVDVMADLVELVALGVGVSLLPSAAVRMAGGRAIGIATDPSIPRELMLVTPLDRQLSPGGAAFLELLDSIRQRSAFMTRSGAPRAGLASSARVVRRRSGAP